MSFARYFYASVAATIAITVHAVITREQFYPIILFLVTSKISFVVLSNMALAAILVLARIAQKALLGTLRDVEVEQLIDRAKYTITETCLALAIFRNDLSPPILGLFGVLLFLKAFHWLSKLRVDYLEQVLPVSISTHIRLISLIVLLFICDIWAVKECIVHTMKNQKSVLILFGFEFGLLVIAVSNLICRYVLHIIDGRMENGLVSKGLCVMLIDLVCDALRILTYFGFFYLVLINYGVPLHIIREMYMAFYTFHKKLTSFIRYIQLTKNLDQRLESATAEELLAAGDCLICREGMTSAKKLPCGHMFHLDCLRMWLQHQQSCPLCRAEIPVTSTPVDTTTDYTATPAGDAAVDADLIPALEEARLLAEAVQGHHSHSHSRIEQSENRLPCFFTVSENSTVEIKAAPSNSSQSIRTLKKGSVIFVTERIEGNFDSDSVWLQVPDGYVRERGILFGALGPPSVVPFDPALHLPKEQINTAHARRLQILEELLPQPASSTTKCSVMGKDTVPSNHDSKDDTSASSRGRETGEKCATPVKGHTHAFGDECSADMNECIRTEESLRGDLFDHLTESEGVFDKMSLIDEQAAAHATAAAKRLLEALSSSANHSDGESAARKIFKSVGSGWGVGTSLDKMITMQAQMEHFATSLEGMHDTVTTCQVVLSQLVDDQVKQYQKIHELRRAVAVKNSGTSYPADYYFEFSCGRGGSSSENISRGNETSLASQSAAENESECNAIHGTEDDLKPLPEGFSAAVADSIIGDATEETQKLVTVKRDKADVDREIIAAKSTVTSEVEEVDLKVTVESILDHSSGAAVHDQIMCCSTTALEENEEMNASTEGENLKSVSASSSDIVQSTGKHANPDFEVENSDGLSSSTAAVMEDVAELRALRYRAKKLEEQNLNN